MANKTITMQKLRLILQLKKQNLSNRGISKKALISRKTVNYYVQGFTNSGKSIDDLLKLNDAELAVLFHSENNLTTEDKRYTDLLIRMEGYQKELDKPRTRTTKMILFEEYKAEVPEGYSRSQFYQHLQRYSEQTKAVMHFEHEPGKLMEFDFAGDDLEYVDPNTGEVIKCPVLVCVFPFSKYTYVEALRNAKREPLFAALSNALTYFGGVSHSIKSDNLAQVITKANRYEPSLSEIAEQWAAHYGAFLTAARVRKPRDKATVESSVNTVYNRIYAPLRNKCFHSLKELNEFLYQYNNRLNRAKFQGRDYSRYDLFITNEKPVLLPITTDPFVIKHKRTGKIVKHYHVMLGEDKHFYSAARKYVGQEVTIVYDLDNVELYIGHKRIAVHKRDFTPYTFTTDPAHRPANHQFMEEYNGWSEEDFIDRASKVGTHAEQAIKMMLTSGIFPEQTFNSCLGVLRLSDKYGIQRLEQACKRAVTGGKVTYHIVKNILSKRLDQLPVAIQTEFNLPLHENLRGPETFL